MLRNKRYEVKDYDHHTDAKEITDDMNHMNQQGWDAQNILLIDSMGRKDGSVTLSQGTMRVIYVK